jgi:uncharacterized RDD family membrane protein YckC
MAGIGITVLKRNAPWGPFTREQIEEGLKRGDFTANYLAHAPGLKEWLPLGEVLDFMQRHPDAPGVTLPPIPVAVDLPPLPALKPTGPPPQTRPPILPPTRQATPPALEKIASTPVALEPEVKIEPTPVPPPIPVPEPKPEPVDAFIPATFLPRAIAFLLDGAIIFLPVLVLTVVGALCIEVPAFIRTIPHEARMEEWDLLALNDRRLSYLIIGLGWLYGAAFEASPAGATPGKRWMDLKVIGNDGLPIAFFRAAGRNLAKYLSGATFFFGFLMALTGARHLAMHDRMTDTRVVRK